MKEATALVISGSAVPAVPTAANSGTAVAATRKSPRSRAPSAHAAAQPAVARDQAEPSPLGGCGGELAEQEEAHGRAAAARRRAEGREASDVARQPAVACTIV